LALWTGILIVFYLAYVQQQKLQLIGAF